MTLTRIAFATLVVVLAAAAGWSPRATAQGAAPRPHVVYIVSDDQGWKDVGFHGSDIRTPSLDQLAQAGARLEQFYAQPMCTPSRAALMTGRYPHRYGLQTLVIPSAGTYGIPMDERLLSQSLKEAGYRTAIVGKWHLGHADRKYWPRQRGFDYQYGPLLGEIDYFTHSAHGVRDWFRNNQPVKEQGYVTQLLGRDAVKLIEGHDPKTPLFLYLAFTAPHAPYQAPKEYLDRYAHIKDRDRRAYAAMITAMDDQIARRGEGAREARHARQHADRLPERQRRTARCQVHRRGRHVEERDPRRQRPVSRRQGHALRRRHARRRAGQLAGPHPRRRRDRSADAHRRHARRPSCASPARSPIPPSRWTASTCGRRSPRASRRRAPRWCTASSRSAPALRQGDWKLVWQATLPSKVELFNLAQDVGEKHNVAAANAQKVAEMQQRIDALAKEAAAPLIFQDALSAVKPALFGSVVFPAEEKSLERQP